MPGTYKNQNNLQGKLWGNLKKYVLQALESFHATGDGGAEGPRGRGGGLHVLSPEGFKFGNQVQEMTLYIFSGSFFW